MKDEIVRRACWKAYNMDLDQFKELYGPGHDELYLRQKWNQMQLNFSRWFCQLDTEKAEKFMEDL